MVGRDWAVQVAGQERFWCELPGYPELIRLLYGELRRLAREGNLYGVFLELRYCFEALIRWYVLTGIACAAHDGDQELVASLFDPERSLSFGDWVAVFPGRLTAHPQMEGTSLGRLLETMPQQYERAKIVRWRNDTAGHGALQQEDSRAFQEELESKLLALKQILETQAGLAAGICCTEAESSSLHSSIDGGEPFPLDPFIRVVEGDYRLFDSLRDEKKQISCELSYQTGLRTQVERPDFFDLRARYYGAAPITATGSYDDEVFTDELEATLQRFHEQQRYWKQKHYIDALDACMKEHSKGVFLFQSESGTGKSTFANYLDGFGKQKLKRQGVTCRCYYFSRLSFRGRREFCQALQINFSEVPENERSLHGNLPTLPLHTEIGEGAKAMAQFLNEYRKLHKRNFGRDRLLLILDGIDELNAADTDLLNFVPQAEDLDDGVYLLITCRSEGGDGTFQQSFVQGYPFTERNMFEADQENKKLLKQAVKESVYLSGQGLTEEQVERVCNVLNNRFTGLPVIRAVLAQAGNFEDAMNAPSLLQAYLGRLRNLYGRIHFQKVEQVLATLAVAYEPLSVPLIAELGLEESPGADLLAIMKDLSPLLISVRDCNGSRYVLGHPEFGAQLRAEYHEACCRQVRMWLHRMEGPFEPERSLYEEDTYLAGGMYLWFTDILKEKELPQELLERMASTAGCYSQSRDTALHMSRIVRVMSGVKSGYLALWETWKDPMMLACALDAITTCLPKLNHLENMMGCKLAEQEAETILTEMPPACREDSRIVPILFVSYANRMILAESLGDMETAQKCQTEAFSLLEAHPEWIRNEQQIAFLHNRAVDLLHTNPDMTIAFCDAELNFSGSSVFDRIRALTLKSDALKMKGEFAAVEQCLREALQLAQAAAPQQANDAATYPNTLLHYGRFLLNPKHEFAQAVEVLTEALSFYDRQAKYGALPSRFEGASLLSEIGGAYYGMDAEAQTTDHRQQSLWYTDQSVQIYRVALQQQLQFQPAAAEPIYLNAAYRYHYYGERETALELIGELEAMQNPKHDFGARVMERCEKVRAELDSM